MENKKLTFGASIPVYNRDWYLGPFLDQLLIKNVKCIVSLANNFYSHEGKEEDDIPDKSKLLLQKYFPQVEILEGTYSHHRDSMNAGLNAGKFKDCDVVIVTDCDMYMTSNDWDKFFTWVSDNYPKYDVFSIDFENMIKEYYYDYNYGKAARRGGDYPIMAIQSSQTMKHMTESTSPNEIVWKDNSVTVHHLRWTCHKGKRRGELYNRMPQSDLHEYSPVPTEIMDSFKKWENLLKIL